MLKILQIVPVKGQYVYDKNASKYVFMWALVENGMGETFVTGLGLGLGRDKIGFCHRDDDFDGYTRVG